MRSHGFWRCLQYSNLTQHPLAIFQVYLAGIKTCLFSYETSAFPSVLFCLLDFEPLVFERLQQEIGAANQGTKKNNNNQDCLGGRPPTFFPCNKGKSCFFEAASAHLSRNLRLPGALTLMVTSKLSHRQVCSNENKLVHRTPTFLRPKHFYRSF